MSKIQDLTLWLRTTIKLRIRNNSNVTMGEVAMGQAVFTYDPYNAGARDPANDAESQRKFFFVQELLNQVIPRKRTFVDAAGRNYNLLAENGFFDTATSAALHSFKVNFRMNGVSGIGNTNVSFSNNNGYITYGSTDDTSQTFRKLMRDYRHVGSVADSAAYLNRIVDRETLIGQRVDVRDNLINGTAGSGNDTGLYELYTFVVKKYVTAMMEEGERFAGERGSVADDTAPTDAWTSRLAYFDSGAGALRVGYGPAGSIAEHGRGMSYSYGGSNTIAQFNTNVTRCGAPDSAGVSTDYYGKADKSTCASTGGAGRYAGLFKPELDSGKRHFAAHIWAGIDCTGLMTKMMRNAETTLDGVVMKSKTTAESVHGPGTSALVSSTYQGQDYVNMIPSKDLDKVHAGDLVLYTGAHVAITYSDRVDMAMKKNRVKYRILHAFGSHTTIYPGPDGKFENWRRFSRKVTITSDLKSSYVQQFGRIKLWP